MKRNNIYLRSKFSEKELLLLKKDLIDNSVYFVSKIKNLTLLKEQVEEIARIAVERILINYKFGQDGSLGDLVKATVITDLKVYYEKTFPDQASRVIWPDLDKRAPFDKLVEALKKVKLLPDKRIQTIFDKVDQGLNNRQQNILSTIYEDPCVTYAEISKKFGIRGVMTYKQIQIICNQLLKTLKDLEIII